jgi:predicted nucleic acid-binding protein
MEKYKDQPMDLADASLIVAAERLRMQRIFTLDSDFHIYRLADNSAMECIP